MGTGGRELVVVLAIGMVGVLLAGAAAFGPWYGHLAPRLAPITSVVTPGGSGGHSSRPQAMVANQR